MGEWKTYRLGDLCDSISNTYRGKAQNVVLINTSDVLEGKCLNHRKEPNKNLKGQFKKTFQQGDILYSEIRPSNKRFAYIDFDATDYIASTKLMVLRANEKIRPLYLYYILQSQVVIDELQMLAESRSGTFPQITFSELSLLTTELPDIDSQDKIINILKSLDDKIELNRRINANLEAQAQALFRSWFVDNETNDLTYYELGDVTTITAGGDKPAVYSKDLTEQCCIPIYSNGIDNEGLYGYTNSAKINTASITISARGTIGYVCLRTKPYVPIVRLISVVPNKSELSAEFLYLWALTQNINISGTGTTQQQLTVPDFRKTSIGLPPEETLKRFNNVIIPIFQKIDINKNENKTLSALRDTLLPKLMAGELNLE